MYRVKWMRDGGCSIIDGDCAYIFNNLGQCVKEKQPLLREYVEGMVDLPMASLVSCNGKYDIAIIENDTITRYQPNCVPASNIAMLFNSKGNFLRMLTHKGIIESVENGVVVKNRFNHLIFVYNKGINIRSLMGDFLK